MRLHRPLAALSILVAAFVANGLLLWSEGRAAARNVTIAVVRDGPTEMNEIVDRIRPELDHLLGSDYSATFDLSDTYDAGWNPQRIRPVIEAALRDRDVDIVMGIGWMVSHEAARNDLQLTKPFVSATLQDSDLLGIDFREERRLKTNLSLVAQIQRSDTEVELIKHLINPSRIHVIISKEIFEFIPEVITGLDRYGREIGVELVPVPVSSDWRAALDQLGPDVEMAFFEHTPRLSRAERAAFVEALNERKIPTFSGDGPQDLEIGMLATNRPDMSQALTRRVALNLFQIITGSTTDELPVWLISDAHLVINGKTAAKIGLALNFETRVLATVLYPEALEAQADSLTIRHVLMRADSGNVALSVSNQEVQTVERGKQVLRSPLLPQVGVGALYNKVDNNLVGTFFPEQLARADLSLSQMVFDDALISDFRSAGREHEAAMFRNDSDRLDVYLEAESAFLTYVQTRLLYEIALDNLRLTEGNLDIAKMRVEVGHSGRDEVFRWTAELNQQRRLVTGTESAVETDRIELNRILGAPLRKRWRPETVHEDSFWFQLLRDKLGFAFRSQANFDRFAEVAVAIAMENSPERQFLLKSIEAEGIQLGQRKRSFIVPKVFLDFNYNYSFWQSPDQPELGENFYDFRITAALPLFEGTRRWYDVQLSKSVIVELERRLELTDQFVEQRTRNALRRLQASLPNINYSRVAAENANKNFEVVREKYANGIVNITDLISAQSASFTADQNAMVAMYNFLQDSAAFQRAVAFFADTKNPAEIDRFVEEFRQRSEATETQ